MYAIVVMLTNKQQIMTALSSTDVAVCDLLCAYLSFHSPHHCTEGDTNETYFPPRSLGTNRAGSRENPPCCSTYRTQQCQTTFP